jgi:hypothetical protein
MANSLIIHLRDVLVDQRDLAEKYGVKERFDSGDKRQASSTRLKFVSILIVTSDGEYTLTYNS